MELLLMSPDRPDPIDDAIEICRVNLPPFLYDPSQASLSFNAT